METSKIVVAKERLEYVDAMRGVSMLLVVYFHLTLLFDCVNSSLNPLFQGFRMPLFFFVSGFFAYTTTITPPLLLKKIKNRVLGQLIPTITVGVLYLMTFDMPWEAMIFTEIKAGYWFTLVLFEGFVIYILLAYMLNRVCNAKRMVIYLTLAVGMELLALFSHRWDNESWWKMISGFYLVKYMPYFLLGVCARMYFMRFLKLIENRYLVSCCFIAYVAFVIEGSTVSNGLKGVVGVFFVFSLFYHYRDYFSGPSRIGRSLRYIGRYTLVIYLGHYIIMHGVAAMTPYVRIFTSTWLTGVFIILSLSLLVTGVCLIIERVLRVMPPVYLLLLGPEKKK